MFIGFFEFYGIIEVILEDGEAVWKKAIVSSVNEILMTFLQKETMSPIGGLLSTDYLKSKSISE